MFALSEDNNDEEYNKDLEYIVKKYGIETDGHTNAYIKDQIYAEVYLRRAWKNVLLKLKMPIGVAEEKAEDILLLHRLYARKEKHLFPNVQKELMILKEYIQMI